VLRSEESLVAEGDVVGVARVEVVGRELLEDVAVVGERADGW
jgi:hypothetical protein